VWSKLPLAALSAALLGLMGAAVTGLGANLACQRQAPRPPGESDRQQASTAPTAHDPPEGAPAAGPPAAGPPLVVVNRKCMGTLCEVKVVHPDEAFVRQAVAKGMAEMDRIEALTTSWTDTSDVARVNQAAGKAAAPVAADTMAVIDKGLWVAGRTGGAFDITVGVFKGLWKFDEDNDGSIPDPAEVRRRQLLVRYQDVLVDHAAGTVKLRRPGQRLNLEGLAKGYGVDAAVRAMRAAGLRDFIFHAGGDLFAAGRKGDREWRVGIQDPRAPRGKIIFELSLSNKAFNTSGDYERFVMKDGVRYHHILDARTGFPARACRSVTILADDAFTADTLDTAVFAVGPDKGMALVEDLPGVEAVIVDADNKVHVSSGLAGKIVKRGEPTEGI
jgi:FAD:protein FMN transferase